MKFIEFSVAFITLCLAFLACSPTDPHENFKNILGKDVGKRADDPLNTIALSADWFAGETILENGNTEKKYKYKGSCVYFYEIDRKTNIIVGWRFEGSKADCAIAP